MIEDFRGDESWRLFRILSEFTEGIDKLADTQFAVSIFGSARLPPESHYYQEAQRVAELLAEQGYAVITGGGPGIMEAGNKGAKDSTSIGLNIQLPFEQQPNPYQNVSLEFRYFFVRKVMFVKYSMGYICMPGGFGTLDEFFEALTLMQTHKIHPLPLVLYGADYWKGLLEWIRGTMLGNGLISPEDLDYISLVDTPEEAVKIMNRHRNWKLQRVAESGRKAHETRHGP
jgi:uncharacterized protein (TIGR00730 family)